MKPPELWLALDVPRAKEAAALATKLRSEIAVFKVGLQLFTREGPEVVRSIRGRRGHIFLDLKLCDIPNTVAAAVRSITPLGVDYLTVHAMGGAKMIAAAVEAAASASKGSRRPPRILAVTVLTSIDDAMMNSELRVPGPVTDQVNHLAKLSQRAGAFGVIASPNDLPGIRQICGLDFFVATPGIRPSWAQEAADQRRVANPQDAMRLGASAIVIGRPILEAADPKQAARRILTEIEN